MASEKLDTAEKVMRMVEWSNVEAWEYYEGEQKVRDPLARAKRYVSAQAFLLSWQEGKVPTGWRRPRRLADFEGKYPAPVLETVSEKMASIYNQRNQEKTAQLNMLVRQEKERELHVDHHQQKPEEKIHEGTRGKEDVSTTKKVEQSDLQGLKKDLASLSHHIFEAKSALKIASNTAADATLRIKAISNSLAN